MSDFKVGQLVSVQLSRSAQTGKIVEIKNQTDPVPLKLYRIEGMAMWFPAAALTAINQEGD